jgi:hypothetical protein
MPGCSAENEFACPAMIFYLILIGCSLISSSSVLYHVYKRRDLTEYLLCLLHVSVILLEISFGFNTTDFSDIDNKEFGRSLCVLFGCFRYYAEISMTSIIVLMAWYYLSFVMRRMETFRQQFLQKKVYLYFFIFIFPICLVCLPFSSNRNYSSFHHFGCILSYDNDYGQPWALSYHIIMFSCLFLTLCQLTYCYYTEIKHCDSPWELIQKPYFSISLYVVIAILGFLPCLVLRILVFTRENNDDDDGDNTQQQIFYYFSRVPAVIASLCFSGIYYYNYDNYQHTRKESTSSVASTSSGFNLSAFVSSDVLNSPLIDN